MNRDTQAALAASVGGALVLAVLAGALLSFDPNPFKAWDEMYEQEERMCANITTSAPCGGSVNAAIFGIGFSTGAFLLLSGVIYLMRQGNQPESEKNNE